MRSKLHLCTAIAAILIAASQAQAWIDVDWSLNDSAENEEPEVTVPFTADPFDANSILDTLLERVRTEIDKQGMDRFTLPDFEKAFERKVAGIKLKGWFKARNGWVESLKSIERTGDAKLTVDATSANLDASLGLGILRLGMDYEAKAAILRSSGHVTATVQNNTFSFSGGLDRSSGECRIALKNFKVANLGKIHVKMTGSPHFLNSIKSTVATWLTKKFNDRIQAVVENKVREIIVKKLEEIKC